MKTHTNTRLLQVWVLTIGCTTLALQAQAQYAYTTLDAPLGAPGGYPNHGTWASGISGTNIFGQYFDANGCGHGFRLSGTNWTTIDEPAAGAGPGQGTTASRMSGTNLVGSYVDASGVNHGFLLAGTNWSTLDYPGAGTGANQGIFGAGQGTSANGIWGTNIVGTWIDSGGVLHGYLFDGVNWTPLNNPAAGNASGEGTTAQDISGTNVVGWYLAASGVHHGYLYNGSTFTDLDDPIGTQNAAYGISGNRMVGFFVAGSGNNFTSLHGYLFNGTNFVTLGEPLGGAIAHGICGDSIVGWYYDVSNNVHGFLATPIPRLSVTHVGGSVKVSWPYSPLASWTLQQIPDLSSTNWTANGAASNDGTNGFVTITATAGNSLFRLRRQ